MTDDTEKATAPIDVLVVASWFPAYDDLAAGRFVADQTEAVGATGAVRPRVVSFDGARLSGGARSRSHQAETMTDASITALRAASPLFVAPAWGVDPALPVARLSVAEGQTQASGVEHAAVHRQRVLRALAERLAVIPPARAVVHAHTVYPDGAAAAVLAERLGWPLVITEHASFVERIVATPALRARYEGTLASAHAVLAVSNILAAELRAAFPAHASRIAVLPNAVPVELFRSPPLEERVQDQLLFVGYRKTTKGIENLLRAVAIAHGRRPSITVRLIGRSPDEATEAHWAALAADLGIADIVTLEQPLDRAGIAEAMAEASIFVHPSPRETFGVVAVEALASGLPVVATDSGGVSEIMGRNPDDVGALVAVDDPEALADAVVRTLERRAGFDPVALRTGVERRFGASYVAERLLVVYREALLRRTPTEGGSAADAAEPDPTLISRSPQRRTVIVALDRARAALRLEPLPDALREQVDVVTSSEPAGVHLPPVGRLVEVTIDSGWGPVGPVRRHRPGLAPRLARLARDPIGTVLRRLGRGSGSGSSLRPATIAVRQLVARAGEPVVVLPVDGHDFLAVAPLVTKGTVQLSSGGLRRLADAWNASRSAPLDRSPPGAG